MRLLGLLLVVISSIAFFVVSAFVLSSLAYDISWDVHHLNNYKNKEWRKDDYIEIKKELKKDISKLCIIYIPIMLVYAICMSIGCYNLDVYYKSSYENYISEIISLERDSGIQGSFCLGSGHVDSSMYYYFYTPTERGYKLKKQNHENTYLIEDDSISPCLKEIKDTNTWNEYYVLIVPTNTVIKEYHA